MDFPNHVQDNVDSFPAVNGRDLQPYTDSLSNKVISTGADMLQSFVMTQIEEFSRKQQQQLQNFDNAQ